jgi:hypothetical protein
MLTLFTTIAGRFLISGVLLLLVGIVLQWRHSNLVLARILQVLGLVLIVAIGVMFLFTRLSRSP